MADRIFSTDARPGNKNDVSDTTTSPGAAIEVLVRDGSGVTRTELLLALRRIREYVHECAMN